MPNGIVPTIKLSMELTKVLADIEMNGLHINTDILTNIKVKFEKELVALQKYLNDKVKYFMSDTPINLDSTLYTAIELVPLWADAHKLPSVSHRIPSVESLPVSAKTFPPIKIFFSSKFL